MRGRSAIALFDQILANASNAFIVLALAGSLSETEFGAFTVSYAIVAFMVGMTRSLFSTSISMSSGVQDEVNEETQRAVASLLALAPVVIAVTYAPSMVSTQGSQVLAILALAVPLVLIQDTLRFSCVALGRPSLAVWSDLLWAGISAGVFAVNLIVGLPAIVIISCWFAGALLATALFFLLLGVRPRFRGHKTWFMASGRLRLNLSIGTSAMSASVPAGYWLYSLMGGTEAVGAIGGGSQLMAPVNTLTAFLGFYALSFMAGFTSRAKRHHMVLAGASVALLALLWGAVLISIPDQWGAALLGSTWPATRQVLPLMVIQYAIGAMAVALTLLVTSEGRSRAVLAIGLTVAASRMLAVAIAGANSDSAQALVIAEVATMAVWVSVAVISIIRTRSAS